jgi:tol-pal system protein YbgF
MTIRRLPVAIALAAYMAASAGSVLAQEGRLSLAERVTRLEQQEQSQPAPGSANMELLNRIQELQTELQSLRNLAEQQAFQIEDLKKRQRDQYVDLDSRIQSLQGGGTPASGGALDLDSPAPTSAPPPVPAQPADPNQLMMEEAEAVDPYTGEPIPRGTAAAPPATSLDPGLSAAPAGDPLADYQTAFDALKQGRYDESTALFNAFLRQYPTHELADNALYWLGESRYVTQNYDQALATFSDLAARYPDGEKTADAELKIGYCLYELARYEEAETALLGVTQRYPDSTVARLAQSRLRALALEQR